MPARVIISTPLSLHRRHRHRRTGTNKKNDTTAESLLIRHDTFKKKNQKKNRENKVVQNCKIRVTVVLDFPFPSSISLFCFPHPAILPRGLSVFFPCSHRMQYAATKTKVTSISMPTPMRMPGTKNWEAASYPESQEGGKKKKRGKKKTER